MLWMNWRGVDSSSVHIHIHTNNRVVTVTFSNLVLVGGGKTYTEHAMWKKFTYLPTKAIEENE